jgi:ferrous iron transport protein B
MTTLKDLQLRQSGRISAVGGDGEVAARLMAIGLLPGVTVRVLGVAPFGDPMLVEVNGWQLSIRRSEAASLMIDSVEPDTRLS